MKTEIFGGMVWEEDEEETEQVNARTVCHECAEKAGYKPKRKAVGVWMDECEICHKQKPCTDLVHDWGKK